MFQTECAAMCYEGGRLTRVRYGTHPESAAPSAIVLDFEGGSRALTVNEDDDTVEIADATFGLPPEDLRFDPTPAGTVAALVARLAQEAAPEGRDACAADPDEVLCPDR